jgi:hypothetical protein
VNWSGLIIACILGAMGSALSSEGKRWYNQLAGFVATGVAGAILWISATPPTIMLDKENCAQYVQVNQEWKCVPWEEAG